MRQPFKIGWPKYRSPPPPMKVTIELADDLVDRAKAHAAKQRTSLRALVEQGLHEVLNADEPVRFRLEQASVGGRGLQKEYQGVEWPRIRGAAYEARGG